MYYVMMDFEWNTAYAYKRSGFINEIIEIGAVVFEYDNGIRIIDRYSEFIKPKVTKKLTGRVNRIPTSKRENLLQRPFLNSRQWSAGTITPS